MTSAQPASQPISPSSSFWIDERTKGDLESRANAGSGEAAFRLANFYAFIAQDGKQEERWLEVASANGHSLAQLRLAYKLMTMTPPQWDRALHWAEASKRAGNEKAQDLIDEIRRSRK